jgi:hypothetical protein
MKLNVFDTLIQTVGDFDVLTDQTIIRRKPASAIYATLLSLGVFPWIAHLRMGSKPSSPAGLIPQLKHDALFTESRWQLF